jgi:hypothetical protein
MLGGSIHAMVVVGLDKSVRKRDKSPQELVHVCNASVGTPPPSPLPPPLPTFY